ncbi:FadR/GntR family transcriptional regulator [Roseomonas populi]|uniref:FadR family transcriptional regulator n=1 Tax=Roseomonas populi TaxID=3121582 RepID=A0ABT1X513_9PROT|nr:FadR/GntR family transcriptional regulator [Roseomonas pecuniae]MCR0982809.1 FadR family transcriptional regulator [Roseomonas pecuniae]
MNQPARRPLSDEVYERLCDLLGSEGFPRDSRLPAELELARRFAVSRPVLRQALARLRAEGHIVSRKGSGSYVRESPRPASPSFGPLHSIPDMRAFLEFRCSLESEVAAHAARRADPAAIAEILRAQARLEKDATELEADVAFHHAIARAAGNRFFLTTLEAFREQMISGIRLTRELAGRPEGAGPPEIAREHARIVDAITAMDEQAARQAMAEHLRGGIRRLFGA